ncbi:MAG: ABC transporter substrate-binding protein, partial [Chloroflexota bacterium]
AKMGKVQKAEPFLKVQTTRVTRPSKFLAAKYNQGSTYFFQGVNEILNGQNPSTIVPQMQLEIQRLLR